MSAPTEIRWHARAGQGAKTAAQILALALLREGKGVQAFPEYGPERRGAPLRAFTRVADRPIRRHDTITDPDVVVVLEPSLVGEAAVVDGLQPDGFVVLNGETAPPELAGLVVRGHGDGRLRPGLHRAAVSRLSGSSVGHSALPRAVAARGGGRLSPT